jgi:hypothetical protein
MSANRKPRATHKPRVQGKSAIVNKKVDTLCSIFRRSKTCIKLSIPVNDDFFDRLPQRVRDNVRVWVTVFSRVPLVRPIKYWLALIAHIIGSTEHTARRRYDALRAGGDWRVFIDYRSLESVRASVIRNSKFQKFIKKIYNQQKPCVFRVVIAELHEMWRRREPIPGYENHPGWPNLPRGWTERNLYRHRPSKTEGAK